MTIKEYLFGKKKFIPANDYFLPDEQKAIRDAGIEARQEERRRLRPYIKALRYTAYGLSLIVGMSLMARISGFLRHGNSPGGEILIPFAIIFLVWTIKDVEREKKGDNR